MDAAGWKNAETLRILYDVPIGASDSDNVGDELLKEVNVCLRTTQDLKLFARLIRSVLIYINMFMKLSATFSTQLSRGQ